MLGIGNVYDNIPDLNRDGIRMERPAFYPSGTGLGSLRCIPVRSLPVRRRITSRCMRTASLFRWVQRHFLIERSFFLSVRCCTTRIPGTKRSRSTPASVSPRSNIWRLRRIECVAGPLRTWWTPPSSCAKIKTARKTPLERVGSSGVFRILSTRIRLSLSSGITPCLR